MSGEKKGDVIAIILPWIVLALEGAICFFFSSAMEQNSFFFSFAVIAINSFAVFAACHNKKNNLLLVLGFLFRCLLLFWDCNIGFLPNSGQDTLTYHYGAVSGMRNGNYGRGGLYSQFVGVIYRAFGVQIPIAQYVNVLLGMTMIFVVIKLLEEQQMEEKTIFGATALLCFLPNLAIMNAILLRETVVMFFVAVSLLFLMRWYRSGSIGMFLWSVAAGLAASAFHSGAIAIVAGAGLLLLLYSPTEKRFNLNTGRVVLAVILTIAFALLMSKWGDTFLGKFGNVSSAEDIVEAVDSRVDGGSAYSVGIPIGNTYLNLLVNTPIRMFYFVASPLPWNWRGLNDIIAFVLDASVFLYALWLSVSELRYAEETNKHQIIAVLLLALVSAAVFAWGVSNAGTALRHREKFIAVYALLIALCRNQRLCREWEAQNA